MNDDQVKGRIDQAKGKIKEVTGDVTGNGSLERKGQAEKIGGKAQATYGDVKQDVKDSVDPDRNRV